MNKNFKLQSAILIIVTILISCNQSTESKFHQLKGPYLGQKPPGMTPELFAPGLLSAGGDEANITFTPDGKELCYTLWTPAGDNLAEPKWPFLHYIIMYTRMENGHWLEPKEFLFNPDRKEIYPFFSPNGKKLYFASRRSGAGRMMYAEKSNGEWCDPKEIHLPIHGFISVASNGNLYFTVQDKNIEGPYNYFIHMSCYENGKYTKPVKLSNAINDEGCFRPYIAPDESYIIFDRRKSDNNIGNKNKEDLYISFRDRNSEWTKAQNMGISINTEYRDKRPFVSFDGKYLFFASNRIENSEPPNGPLTLKELRQLTSVPANGCEHIYWVDAKVIEELRPDELK